MVKRSWSQSMSAARSGATSKDIRSRSVSKPASSSTARKSASNAGSAATPSASHWASIELGGGSDHGGRALFHRPRLQHPTKARLGPKHLHAQPNLRNREATNRIAKADTLTVVERDRAHASTAIELDDGAFTRDQHETTVRTDAGTFNYIRAGSTHWINATSANPRERGFRLD
jgi:hypothetical protein